MKRGPLRRHVGRQRRRLGWTVQAVPPQCCVSPRRRNRRSARRLRPRHACGHRGPRGFPANFQQLRAAATTFVQSAGRHRRVQLLVAALERSARSRQTCRLFGNQLESGRSAAAAASCSSASANLPRWLSLRADSEPPGDFAKRLQRDARHPAFFQRLDPRLGAGKSLASR